MLLIWKEWEIKNWKENRCPESGKEIKTRKTKITIGDCIKVA